MLGIVVCTHSTLAKGFKDAVEMIMGNQDKFEVIGFFPGDDILILSEKIKSIIKEMNTAENIIFTDLFGASPSNAATISIMNLCATIITGVNIGMIAEALVMRHNYSSLNELTDHICEVGKNGIKVITRELIMNNSGGDVKDD